MHVEFLEKIVAFLLMNFAELCFFGAIMIALQYFIPVWPGQKNWDKSSWLDVGYSFFLSFSSPFFAAVPIAMVGALIGLSPALKSLPVFITQTWGVPVQLLVAVIVIDFVSYWRHRMMHMKWLWPVHAIHHCSSRLNWLSTERFHILNYFISTVINTVTILLLFGPEVAIMAALLRRFYNFFIHANVNVDYGVLGYIFVSPRFHHWHHSYDAQAANKNYCTFFSCIDLLFGTFYLPGERAPVKNLGIEDSLAENFGEQFLYPFKTWYSWLRANRVG
jgi:sterol desaturase/sphingolipid hydroxylase (fatty acid hydroxylase superfamily)